MRQTEKNSVGVAILGFGVVGSGVAQVLEENREQIESRAGVPVRVRYILDRKDLSATAYAGLAAKDMETILADPEVQVVVEAIGGVGAALDYTRRALETGKSVVTSNKELVAEHGAELMALAKEKGVSYLYEASVAGGIPLLHPIKACLGANRITEVRGILNGTTNYILTRMFRDRLPFEEALAEAQAKGYAEADPTADVEGIDACRKVCILASLLSGAWVSPAGVPCEGIRAVTAQDVAYAASAGYQIKLLGRALVGEDGAVRAYVAPHLLPAEDPLACAEDVFNAVVVRGNAVGDVMFYGRGAGALPTASAVVSDILETVRAVGRPKRADWAETPAPISDLPLVSRWYVRIGCAPEALRRALGEVSFLSRQGAQPGESALLTAPMEVGALEKKLSGLGDYTAFRVLED